MISLDTIAELDLSAASGLARVGAHVFVVADDELFVDAYSVSAGARAARIPLSSGAALPEGGDRKRLKPDLESLLLLPGERLLALGSGSTPLRCTAHLFDAPAPGAFPAGSEARSLSPLYEALGARFGELNIEGAALAGGRIRLLQRGNGAKGENAVIDLDLPRSLAALDRAEPWTWDLVISVRPVDLGDLRGVRLGFTDAAPLEAGSRALLFTAAAEDTEDPYLDGACSGSALGILDEDGRVARMEPVDGDWKLEGVTLSEGGGALLVADPDDRGRRAPLLVARARFW